MNIVLASLLITTLLPIICSWVSGYYRHKQLGTVDNKCPRLQITQLEGAGHRAVAAQQNSWEALGMYTAALLALHIAGVAIATVSTWAMVFVAARVVYVACYLANQDILRSLSFLVGFGTCIYFFCIALGAAA